MDPKKIARWTTLLESGGLSAREWANSLLYDLVSSPNVDKDFVSLLDSLPHEVGQDFRRLLAKIEAAEFHWTPFFLTSSATPRDPTEYSAQLRQICALLRQERADNGKPRITEPGGRETVGAEKRIGTLADTE